MRDYLTSMTNNQYLNMFTLDAILGMPKWSAEYESDGWWNVRVVTDSATTTPMVNGEPRDSCIDNAKGDDWYREVGDDDGGKYKKDYMVFHPKHGVCTSEWRVSERTDTVATNELTSGAIEDPGVKILEAECNSTPP